MAHDESDFDDTCLAQEIQYLKEMLKEGGESANQAIEELNALVGHLSAEAREYESKAFCKTCAACRDARAKKMAQKKTEEPKSRFPVVPEDKSGW